MESQKNKRDTAIPIKKNKAEGIVLPDIKLQGYNNQNSTGLA